MFRLIRNLTNLFTTTNAHKINATPRSRVGLETLEGRAVPAALVASHAVPPLAHSQTLFVQSAPSIRPERTIETTTIQRESLTSALDSPIRKVQFQQVPTNLNASIQAEQALAARYEALFQIRRFQESPGGDRIDH